MHGGFWAFALRVVSRLFGLVKIIVLARLLAPEDFGLFGVASLALSTLRSFTNTGFGTALIQKSDEIEEYLPTAWTTGLLRNLSLAIIMVLVAPGVGEFFGEPKAVLLVRVLATKMVLDGFKNVAIIYFKKELEFHKKFLYQFVGTFTNISVAVPLAFALRSAWPLIYGSLAMSAVQLVLSYWLHPYRPSFAINMKQVRELFDYGKWVFAGSLLTFIATQGDDIFLGRFLGASALGIYQYAYRLANSVATEITNTVSQVTFPAYSKLQNNLPRLKRAFIDTVSFVTSLSFPLAFGIFLLIPEFVHLFLEPKWIPIIGPVRILVVAGFIRSIAAAWGPLYNAQGEPKRTFVQNGWRVAATFLPIYFLTKDFGVQGTSIAVLIGIIAALIYNVYYVERRTALPLRIFEVFQNLLPSLAGLVPFIGIIVTAKTYLDLHRMSFLLLLPVSLLLYSAGLYLFQLLFGYSPWKRVVELLKK